MITRVIPTLTTIALALGSLSCATGPNRPGPLASAPSRVDGSAPPATLIQRAPGYLAHLHLPVELRNGQRLPAVMLIGGSGGGIGWQDYMADRLAARGIVALAVAYFAIDSLPPELDRIPLEAFDDALGWLRKQRYVDGARTGIGGVSKGAEAALLVAAAHPELRAVAVFSPSGIVFQSVTADFRPTSSWTLNGKELPFVAYGKAAAGSPTVEFYRSGIRSSDPATLDAATIRVERITSPILLLSGRDDTLWGSGDLANMIAERLRSQHFGPRVENIIYPDAGHLISSIRDDDVTNRGGTKAGNTAAQVDGQRRFLEFFVRELGTRR